MRKSNKPEVEIDNDDIVESGDAMSFEEIAIRLNMTTAQVKMIFKRAMKKLRYPNEINRKLWNYAKGI